MKTLCALSNNAVRVDELPGHLHIPARLVEEGEVEGDLSLQIHLIVRHTLQERTRGKHLIGLQNSCGCSSTSG